MFGCLAFSDLPWSFLDYHDITTIFGFCLLFHFVTSFLDNGWIDDIISYAYREVMIDGFGQQQQEKKVMTHACT